MTEVFSSLLNAFEPWYLSVVTAEVDNPIPLIERMLAIPDKLQVLFSFLFGQPVDSHEVSE